jgi:hypothetical protein
MRRGENVKAKALLLFISLGCALTVHSFGQVDCTTSTKLVCQLPASITYVLPFANNTNFAKIRAEAIADTSAINGSLATQLTQLPVPSATVGVVSLKQRGSDIGVPFENLGPVLTDRPDTVGRGHLFAGFSYQHFNFNAIDGINLGSLPLGFSLNQAALNNPTDIQTFYVGDTNKVGFQLDQYVGVFTYGVTRKTDVSVVVPFTSVSLSVLSSGSLAYIYDPVSGQYSNDSPQAGTTLKTSGSSKGFGDVTLSVKQLVLGSEGSRGAIAAGASARFPTGDALNYLGSGAYGGNVYGLFEYRARVAPHLKLSYQWNNVSQLLDLQNAPHIRLPGGLEFDAGADAKINRHLTVAADFLGTQFINTTSLAATIVPLTPASSTVPASLAGLALSPQNTYTTSNFSVGVKWSPIAHLLLYGNVMMQLNNVGLRSDPVPLFGIAYNFKTRK